MKNLLTKILIILTGIILTVSVSVSAGEFKFSKTIIYPLEKDGLVEEVEVSTPNGFIYILPNKEKNYKVTVSYKITGKNREEAEETADTITKTSKISNRLYCGIKHPKSNIKIFKFFNKDKKNIEASVIVYLPPKYLYRANINIVNGSFTAGEVKLKSIETNIVNGNSIVNSSFEELNINTVNGNIAVSPPKIAKEAYVDLNITNGKVIILLEKQKDLGINADASTLAGSINTNIPGLSDKLKKRFWISPVLKGETDNFHNSANKLFIKINCLRGKISVMQK
ncbi:MAG: DUF4097 family beta strand repeat-containing protein [Armatimonadota bacterium]